MEGHLPTFSLHAITYIPGPKLKPKPQSNSTPFPHNTPLPVFTRPGTDKEDGTTQQLGLE